MHLPYISDFISEPTIKIIILVAGSFIIHQIAYRIFIPLFTVMSRKTKTKWDNILIRRKVISRAFHLLPATLISIGLPVILGESTGKYTLLLRSIIIYYIIVGYAVFEALLNTIRDIFEMQELAKRVSIRGFIQAFKVIGTLCAIVMVISQLVGKSPLYFLSGLGAFTAVLLLIFKDTILGLVAGIQLTTMDLVRKGDWIEMPKHGADGDVIDISLTTVRVQNWDKTVTAIPAYELVSSSFKNWRAMSECGGRRIKRPIPVDITSIRFLDTSDLEHLRKIKVLQPYLEQKIAEITTSNNASFCDTDMSILGNGRRLTNIGTFRAYCVAYLRNHPGINQKLTFIVRQLDPTPGGLPLEIYVFCNEVRWVIYEGIQSDVFDHLLAILPEFGLRVFQNPAGADIRAGMADLIH